MTAYSDALRDSLAAIERKEGARWDGEQFVPWEKAMTETKRGGTERENVSVAAAAAPLDQTAEVIEAPNRSPGYGVTFTGWAPEGWCVRVGGNVMTGLRAFPIAGGNVNLVLDERYVVMGSPEEVAKWIAFMCVLAGKDGAGEKAGITQAERAQRTSEHPSLSSTGDERREALQEKTYGGYTISELEERLTKSAQNHDLYRTSPSVFEVACYYLIRSLLHADGGEKPCEHEWSEWEPVLGGRGYHVERKCSKCGKEQYDD